MISGPDRGAKNLCSRKKSAPIDHLSSPRCLHNDLLATLLLVISMMKTLITVLLSLFHMSIAAAAAACECQPIGPPSFIVTRLWNVNPSSNFTDQDVIAEFDNGFAPVVTHMPGFQRYTASTTGECP